MPPNRRFRGNGKWRRIRDMETESGKPGPGRYRGASNKRPTVPPVSDVLYDGSLRSLITPGEAIWLIKTVPMFPEAVVTNPETLNLVSALGQRIVGRMIALGNSLATEDLIAKWRWARLFVPLQVRLFLEQCAYDAGGLWRRDLITGFGVMKRRDAPQAAPPGGAQQTDSGSRTEVSSRTSDPRQYRGRQER